MAALEGRCRAAEQERDAAVANLEEVEKKAMEKEKEVPETAHVEEITRAKREAEEAKVHAKELEVEVEETRAKLDERDAALVKVGDEKRNFENIYKKTKESLAKDKEQIETMAASLKEKEVQVDNLLEKMSKVEGARDAAMAEAREQKVAREEVEARKAAVDQQGQVLAEETEELRRRVKAEAAARVQETSSLGRSLAEREERVGQLEAEARAASTELQNQVSLVWLGQKIKTKFFVLITLYHPVSPCTVGSYQTGWSWPT